MSTFYDVIVVVSPDPYDVNSVALYDVNLDGNMYPVTGWWRQRPHLGCANRPARYALVVSLETASTEVELYTAIASKIAVGSGL